MEATVTVAFHPCVPPRPSDIRRSSLVPRLRTLGDLKSGTVRDFTDVRALQVSKLSYALYDIAACPVPWLSQFLGCQVHAAKSEPILWATACTLRLDELTRKIACRQRYAIIALVWNDSLTTEESRQIGKRLLLAKVGKRLRGTGPVRSKPGYPAQQCMYIKAVVHVIGRRFAH